MAFWLHVRRVVVATAPQRALGEIVSVPGNAMSKLRAALTYALLVSACSSAPSTTPSPLTPTVPVVTSIQVGVLGNGSPVLEPNQGKQFWALGSYADGTTVDLTNTALWRTSNPVVATVTSGGLVTGGGVGHADISATVSTVTGALGVEVAVPPGCRYVVNPPRLIFSAFGGSSTVSVVASASDCRWRVTSDASWLQFSYDPRVSGSGTFFYSVPGNSTPSIRDANLVISGTDGTTAVHSLEQERPVSCSYVVTPDHSDIPLAGGSRSFRVDTTPNDCRWNATAPSYSPIHITSGSSGTGNGVVTFTVPALSYPTTGTVQVAGLSGQNPPGIHTVVIK